MTPDHTSNFLPYSMRLTRWLAGARLAPWNHQFFSLLWLFIIAVSVHDGLLVLTNRTAMLHNERNPLGRWLIHINSGDVWLLLTAKSIGTVMAAALILLLFWGNGRTGWIVCALVAAVQVVLLLSLYLS
jgi:hypothetical protein